MKYSFLAVSEEFASANRHYNQQVNLVYKTILNGDIAETRFKGLESDDLNYEWVDVDKIDNYKIFPNGIKQAIKNPNKIYHFVETDISHGINQKIDRK